MARDKPPILKLHELVAGQGPADFFALLAEKTRTSTRDGKAFFNCKFRDRRKTVSCAVWSDSPLFHDCEKAWQPGTVYKVRGVYAEHEKYGPQIEVVMIRAATDADDVDEAEFFERSRFDSHVMLAELLALVDEEVEDPPLKQLVIDLLDTHADTLKKLPATLKTFYPFPGGWLEHVLNVTRSCCWLADRYAERFPNLKPFNRDLVVAGAVLHDIGRVAELTVTGDGQTSELSVAGHLIGHVQLSRDLVRDAARAIPEFNPELLQLLEHVILTHLTRPEWGSPKLPMIPEVLILHHADDLDAKFEMFARLLGKDAVEGPFTERDPVLGKQLLKRRLV
jgi:3'-5' exoribonuclease